jgi:carboxyl-terminal processing protease
LPNVTHVGTHTRGAFSDVLTRRLPNGWSLGISNEVYTDPQGQVWEGRGVEPDVTLRVFDLANPLRGHTEAVRAIQRMAASGQRREATQR